MPKRARELSAVELKRLKHPGGHERPTAFAVGGVAGLHIQITPSGARSWLLRATVGAKRREIGLGPFPDVTLAGARERAREIKDQIFRGIDPVEERRFKRAAAFASQVRGMTFTDAVDGFLKGKVAEFRSAKHASQWHATLAAYAEPKIGKMAVDAIDVHDVIRVLEPIWTDKTETAVRLRGRIEAVLAWATVKGHRKGDNPARWKGNLDAILPKPGKVATRGNHPAIALDDVAHFFAHLRQMPGVAARALELAAQTASRSGEVRGARWSEFDLAAGIWTIPADRMKADREHRVPLTPDAVALLKAMPRLDGFSHVFPAGLDKPLSDMALSAVMRRMQEAETGAGRQGYIDPRNGRPAVPHGLRSTFRDWTAERTDYPSEMAEISLAHNVGSKVELAYRRGDMIERRRAMMAAWGRFLRGEAGAKVVMMRGAS